MELPFTVVFEPPSQDELCAVLRMRRTWLAVLLVALSVGTLTTVSAVGRGAAGASSPTVPLEVTSRPPGAAVWLDGSPQGHTPLAVPVVPGPHAVLLKSAYGLDGEYTVQAGDQPTELDAVLWRRQPELTRLRPTLPGAVLSNVQLLADGELALSIALPPGRQLQGWRFDPLSGTLESILTDGVGTRLAVSPDGHHVGMVGYEVGPSPTGFDGSVSGAGRANVVWLEEDGRPAPDAAWRVPVSDGEELVDVRWSPHADRLLAVTTQTLGGGAMRSRVWFADAEGHGGHAVLSLPSQIVPGSEAWSPDGQHVAFVAHAGEVNALCLVDLDGVFRYVADLEPSTAPSLAFASAAWAPDSHRLVFVAPHQHPPGVAFSWLQADSQRALYVADAADPAPVSGSDTEVDQAAWREDGQLVGLGRVGVEGTLALSLVGRSGSSQHLVDLPLKPGTGYAAAWDLPHARLLLATPSAVGDGVDYWLAALGAEGEP